MNEWKEYRFSEFVDINPTVKLPKDELISFVEMKDLDPGKRYCLPSQKRLLSGGSKFEDGDTLFARITPCLENGKICQVKGLKKGQGLGSTEFHVFRGKENISDSDFVYYLSRWDEVRSHAEINLDGTSGRQRVPKEAFNDLTLLLPSSLPEQETIAFVLSSLDNKIDLLHRQNATLEKMAETLFRQCFVEKAKEEWEEGIIADLAIHFKKSVNPQKNGNIQYLHYSIPAFDANKKPISIVGKDIQSNKYNVPENCILFSKLNPHKDKRVWLIQNVDPNSICSTEFQVILPMKKAYLWFLYGWLTLSENYNEIALGVGGTSGSHQRIDPSTIFSFNCPKVNNSILDHYNNLVEPIFEKQLSNQKQISSLTSLRNTLLPKLMSGEVRI
jgi:type I restriction enzyme S subunit